MRGQFTVFSERFLMKADFFMHTTTFSIQSAPAVLYGEPSDRVVLFVHGQCGFKEDAAPFAELAAPKGWQVLSVDLPEHGGRTDGVPLLPWAVVPELSAAMAYAQAHWQHIAVRATSIGAWFSLLAFAGTPVECCLLVSPLTDMAGMISSMMQAANVTEAQLEAVQEIAVPGGPALSWRYLCYARSHTAAAISDQTHVLWASGDAMIPKSAVDAFVQKASAVLTVYPGGEHWFHTDEQVAFLRRWEAAALPNHA